MKPSKIYQSKEVQNELTGLPQQILLPTRPKIIYFLIIILLILPIFLGSYWNQITPEETGEKPEKVTTISAIETGIKGWKKYENKNNIFSIRYPNDWLTEESDGLITFKSKDDQDSVSVLFIKNGNLKKEEQKIISQSRNQDYFAFGEYKRINNYKYTDISGAEKYVSYALFDENSIIYILKSNGTENSNSIMDKMIYFIDFEQKIDLTQWKTYENLKFSYKIKYPENWVLYDNGANEDYKDYPRDYHSVPENTLIGGVLIIKSDNTSLTLTNYKSKQKIDLCNWLEGYAQCCSSWSPFQMEHICVSPKFALYVPISDSGYKIKDVGYAFLKNDYEIYFFTYSGISKDDTQKMQIFNTIAETFEFF